MQAADLGPKVVAALAVAFAVAALLIPMMNRPAQRVGLVDHPNHRKRHIRSTPLTGGLAIVAGFIAGLWLTDVAWLPYWTLIAGALIIMATGLLDDLFDVPARARLLIQIGVAALMVWGGGLKVQVLGLPFGADFGPVGLGALAAPFTIACVVFMINAINMADGLDGLAGGMSTLILLMLALVAFLGNLEAGLVLLPLVLALATLGFLVHNLRLPGGRHARAFLGDTGSMMLGYVVAWTAVAIGIQPDTSVYPITVAWLLIVPGMDTLALFFRRIRLGRSPFSADRTHIHHILRRCGYSVPTTVLIIYALVATSGMVGVLGWLKGWPQWLMFAIAAAIMLGYQWLLAHASGLLKWHRRRRG